MGSQRQVATQAPGQLPTQTEAIARALVASAGGAPLALAKNPLPLLLGNGATTVPQQQLHCISAGGPAKPHGRLWWGIAEGIFNEIGKDFRNGVHVPCPLGQVFGLMPRASRGFTTGLGTAQQGGETFLQLTVHPAGAEGWE